MATLRLGIFIGMDGFTTVQCQDWIPPHGFKELISAGQKFHPLPFLISLLPLHMLVFRHTTSLISYDS